MLIKGNELTPQLRALVLRMYVYRWTFENDQRERAWHGLKPPSMPLQTDEQWLQEHCFRVTKTGSLDGRSHYAFAAYFADE